MSKRRSGPWVGQRRMSQDHAETLRRAIDSFDESSKAVAGAGGPLPWLPEFCGVNFRWQFFGEDRTACPEAAALAR